MSVSCVTIPASVLGSPLKWALLASPQGLHVLRRDFNPHRLADIRANDGNLSIPLYVRGKAVSDEKGEYAADGLREAVLAWKKSSEELRHRIKEIIFLEEET